MSSNIQNEQSKTIGNRETDTHLEDTIYGKAITTYEHQHAQAKLYPSLQDGVILTGHANAWTLGTITEIVPASTITEYFDIHWIIIESVSANDIYEIVLYQGAGGSEVEIGRVKFVKNTTAGSGVVSIPFQMIIVDPNTRISGAVASKTGGGDTVTISLGYHEYD